MKKYKVTLTAEERQELQELIAVGRGAAQGLIHARILLKADAAEGGPGWADAKIAEAVEVSIPTIERVRRRFVEDGFEAALKRKPQARPSRVPKLDGLPKHASLPWPVRRRLRVERSGPWLADRLVELKIVDTVSDETVRRALKKTNSSLG